MKINILFLDHSNDYSGGQVSLVTLISLLDRQKVNPTVAVDADAGHLKEALTRLSVDYIEFPFSKITFRRIIPFLRLAVQLRATVRKREIDLLHANTFMTGLILSVLKRWLKVPLIFRARLAIDHHSHGIIDRIITNGADLILANSFYVKKTFEDRFGRKEKIVTVYNPLKLNLKDSAIRRIEGEFVFAVVGRIESIKRHLDIVEAVEILASQEIGFKVKIIGAPSKLDKGKYFQKVRAAISDRGLDRYFEWTGFVPEPMQNISSINACISCTIGEALSRTVFECQFSGIPVVASASGGNLELIEDGVTGFLFTPGNANELAGKMCQVIENYQADGLEDLRDRARNQTISLFNEEKTVRREELLYQNLMTSKQKK